MLFEEQYKKLLNKYIIEAGENPDGGMGEGPDEGGLNLPDLSELEGDAGEQDSTQEAKPEEYELAKLAIKTLEASGGLHLNPQIFTNFEKGGNHYEILNYVEKQVHNISGIRDYDNPKFYEALGIKNLKGMTIGQKMKFFQHSSLPAELQLDGQRRQGWIRIILNAARYGYRDFVIDFAENKVNNLELESLYQQLAVDLSFDARGSDYDIQQKI